MFLGNSVSGSVCKPDVMQAQYKLMDELLLDITSDRTELFVKNSGNKEFQKSNRE